MRRGVGTILIAAAVPHERMVPTCFRSLWHKVEFITIGGILGLARQAAQPLGREHAVSTQTTDGCEVTRGTVEACRPRVLPGAKAFWPDRAAGPLEGRRRQARRATTAPPWPLPTAAARLWGLGVSRQPPPPRRDGTAPGRARPAHPAPAPHQPPGR